MEKNLKSKNNKNKDVKDILKKRMENILRFIDVEINNLKYNKAFSYDHRTYVEFYFSLLKTKHIFFQIFNKRDYNSISIKVLLFFYDFVSCYAINALFFNDDTMHQIYEDEGAYNISYQLPQIVYSTAISFITDLIIFSFCLFQVNILDIKKEKNFVMSVKKSKRIERILILKSIMFFVLIFIFILTFWYYLGCFCAVYKNTQYHLIKDTLISYAISTLTPFGYNLIPGLFRIPDLRANKKDKQCLYKFSRLVAII